MDEIENEDKFQYTPLESPRHIRVIKVDRSSNLNEPIRVSFLTTCIDDPCKYQTLSYTWGETFADGSHLTHSVLCEGRPLRISSNLYDFLQDFRSRKGYYWDAYLPIWIDALSISQDDLVERGQQVAIMSGIYRHAEQVNIWLGEIETLNSAEWLPQVFQHPWFTRRWVVQEVLSNSYLGFRMVWIRGRQITQLNELYEHAVMSNIRGLGIDIPLVIELGGFEGSYQQASLLSNLETFRFTQCGDDRDRIYALLNISDNGADFEIDYSASVETVYHRVARVIASGPRRDEFIRLLISSAVRLDPTLPSTWPTRVPDWRNPVRTLNPAESGCFNERGSMDITRLLLKQVYNWVPRSVTGECDDLLNVTGWTFTPCQCAGTDCGVCVPNQHIWQTTAQSWPPNHTLFTRMLPSCLCSNCIILFDHLFSICMEEDKIDLPFLGTEKERGGCEGLEHRNVKALPPSIVNGQVLCVLKEKTTVAFTLSESSAAGTTKDLRYKLSSCLQLPYFIRNARYLEEHAQTAIKITLEKRGIRRSSAIGDGAIEARFTLRTGLSGHLNEEDCYL